MKFTKLPFILAALTVTTSANADFIGARIGISPTTGEWSGSFSGSDQVIDLQEDLNLEDTIGGSFYAAVEHPIPLIPNFMISINQMKSNGGGELGTTVVFEGDRYEAGQDVSTEFDFSHVDTTVYYETFDNWISLDTGFTLRKFNGIASMSDGIRNSEKDIEFSVPLIYGHVRFDIPFTPLYGRVEGNTSVSDKDDIQDVVAAVGFNKGPLGMEAGYKKMKFKYFSEEFSGDISLKGPFLGLFIDI